MRIVIDLQGAQGSNRNRGLGRYSLWLAKSIAQNRGDHDIHLALNGHFQDAIDMVRFEFDGIISQENIHIWYPLPGTEYVSGRHEQRACSEEIYKAFIENLRPDVFIIASLFEGYNDEVVSVHNFQKNILVAVVLYDLIPLIFKSVYLKDPILKSWYEEKLNYLQRADCLLAISEASQQDGITHLSVDKQRCVNISTAASDIFQPLILSDDERQFIQKKYGIYRPFVMYTGGVDHRKNLEGLIHAYSLLSDQVRQEHQLAFVFSVRPEDKNHLEQYALQQGLNPNEFICTGYVPDDDLLKLYNLCKVFIFPSWYEGFGLPALEAMLCGRAVIGSNVSSIPEVIGREDALFDPHNHQSIAEKLTQVLTDDEFRKELEKYSLIQAKEFSWVKTAKRAIAALEAIFNNHKTEDVLGKQKRLKLAYISPLPPEKSGISDYSAELLPALAHHYDIDVIINQETVSTTWIKKNCQIRTVDWFRNNANLYDRVLYHFGNSSFHSHMFDLLKEIPGVVVLHDFFLSGIAHHMEVHMGFQDFHVKELYNAHGYGAVYDYNSQELFKVVMKYPCSYQVFQNSLGIIVHSEYNKNLAKKWYGDTSVTVVPHLRMPSKVDATKMKLKNNLNLDENAFVISSFGILGSLKLNHRLLEAFAQSKLTHEKNCFLIFVGDYLNPYGQELVARVKKLGLKDRILFTGWADESTYRSYLEVSDMAIQLRTHSRGETSGTVLDCMNYGIPTIVNENGSMAELPEGGVCKIQDNFNDEALICALELLYFSEEERKTLSLFAREYILKNHNPEQCAILYKAAIEGDYKKNQPFINLIDKIAQISTQNNSTEKDAAQISQCIAKSFPNNSLKTIFMDISELVQRDAKTGIQRVVRSFLYELLLDPPEGYRIEPIYSINNEDSYRYARNFVFNFLKIAPGGLFDAKDDLVDYQEGDIFLGIDLYPPIVNKKDYFHSLRNKNVKICFFLYDLLPITLKQYFPQPNFFADWLSTVTEVSDLIICISKSTAADLRMWIKENSSKRRRSLQIDCINLGADLENSAPTYGLLDDYLLILDKKGQLNFLMVGTIEPRKGHKQTLAGFDQLWEQGVDANLIIIGKQGWQMEDFIEKINSHPQNHKKLFWFQSISDEYLEKIYSISTCLIAASEGEGYGLPIIEAAQHRLPIIARDISVFREVTQEHAFFFEGLDPSSIKDAIIRWKKLYNSNKHPKSSKIKIITWKESTYQLMDILKSLK